MTTFERDGLGGNIGESIMNQKMAGSAALSKTKSRKERCNDGKGNKRPSLRLSGIKQPRQRVIIPEARVVQAYDECAFISDDESEREYLPLRGFTRKSRWNNGNDMNKGHPPQGSQQGMRHMVMETNATNNNGGFFKSHGAKCYCFNCLPSLM